jgi:hypothetical protein
MAGKIFINYRRGDDSGYAGRLYDRLQDKFEPQQIFMDVDSIAPGLDFVRELNDRVAECDVLLAVIGKDWIDARNAAGGRRLDDPDDFVRIEIAAALSQDKRVIPVLVGGAQMPRPEELPEPLRPLARRNAVRLTYERFRADTQGLIKALQQAFEEIEILEKSKVESEEAARRAEEERRRREREAEFRTAEAGRAKLAEEAALQAKDEERRRLEAAAELREREERGFTAAKNANSVAAFDAFLAEHPKSHFGAEAQRLQAVLRKRETAFAQAMTSNDATALRSFRDRYKDGTDVEKVRKRLQLIAPEQARPQPNFAIIGSAVLVILLVGAAGVWWLMRPAATTRQASVPANAGAPSAPLSPLQMPSSAPPKLAEVPAAQQPPAPSPAPEPQNAAADISPPPPPLALPDNDVDAWAIVKNTGDVALLKRFIAQFPDSFLRRAAEARITALAAVQAAWALLKDSQDPEQLRRFIQAFPNSVESKAAEQRLAIISGAAPASQAPTPPH